MLGHSWGHTWGHGWGHTWGIAGRVGEGGGSPKAPHTTSKKDTRHQYALTRLVTPTGSADDGKRNEMEMDVVYGAGGQMGEGLGEGGEIIDPDGGSADDGKRWDSLSPAMDVAFAIEKWSRINFQ